MYILVHVNNIIVIGNYATLQRLITELNTDLYFKELRDLDYFLSIEIKAFADGPA